MARDSRRLAISSPDVDHLARLADHHTYDGGNEAPQLHVTGVPADATELAIVCHDPDAPFPHGFAHWTLYGIPAGINDIGPDADATYRPGPNDFGHEGYGGPQPPEGHGTHHYYFWVYALNRPVQGAPDRLTFLGEYAEAIVEQNRLVATYSA